MKEKLKKHTRHKQKTFWEKLKPLSTIPNFLVVSMVLLLGASVIAEIFEPTYKTNPLLYGLMGTVVGLLIKSMSNNNK